MFNSYTEEFKKNAVAVVKTGYGVANLAKRLHVPPSSIRNWLDHPKYSGVEPADEKLLAMIPDERTESHGLVQITDDNAFSNTNSLPVLRIKIGNVVIETPENLPAGSFRLLIQALRDSHVL